MAGRRVAVLDYGMGNLRSVINALEAVGADPFRTSDAAEIENADRLVVPGVGAFGEAIANLKARGLVEPIRRFVASGRPCLGICLGMQLFCRSSEENGPNEGLGLFAAKVRRFPERPHLKVPHIGWNQLSFVGAHPVFAGLADGADAYFVHGYYVSCDHEEETIATTGHGVTFASATARDNLVGLQFHPEKSHRVGLRMLTNFLAL